MSPQVKRALRAINQQFYDRFATDFDRSRYHPWSGWQRLLPHFDEAPSAVLDAGCGNGRFGTFLAARSSGAFRYLGIDGCGSLLEAAAERLTDVVDALELRQDDLLADAFDPAPGGERFDLITLFGVLHHVPGATSRSELLSRLGRALTPGGMLAATFWRFDRNPRFQRKVVPWPAYNQQRTRLGRPPLDLKELEPGDTLLSWGGERTHPRYCHFPEDSEVDALATLPGLRLIDRFEADGPSGQDNLYLVWRC